LVTSVAFFRNLNQGQRGHPSTAQLVEAFERTGARGVRTVRSNGTVLFDAEDPDGCLAAVLPQLSAVCGWRDAAFWWEVEWLAQRAAEFPVNIATSLVELSLYDGKLTQDLPLVGNGCSVVQAGLGYAISVNTHPGTSQATPTLERALSTPVTSRAASTVHRVLDAL
jgi:uncharacterized protein (DUF1697 family)